MKAVGAFIPERAPWAGPVMSTRRSCLAGVGSPGDSRMWLRVAAAPVRSFLSDPSGIV
jgi:hypothetical protein